MIQESIHLATIERVQAFTSAMREFDFEVDLTSGRYVINGKSIMGILSLDLAHPIQVTAQVPEDKQERFLEVIHTFA
jgi:phosphocarrier protein HPr